MRRWILLLALVAGLVALLAGLGALRAGMAVAGEALILLGAALVVVVAALGALWTALPPIPALPTPTAPAARPAPPPLAPAAASTADDALANGPWLTLVEECVGLYDELDRHRASLDPPRRELADHVNSRLAEILTRSGVTEIVGDPTFDRRRHQADGVAAQPGAPIAATLSPGFVVGRRVLRRARVTVKTI